MFTGDRSGDWLYRALHKAGFASQPKASSADDGLRLHNCLITAACHCAPPDNKPTSHELDACSDWFQWTVKLSRPTVMVALGQIAWNCIFRFAKQQSWRDGARPKFGHGAEHQAKPGLLVIGSYHPSQQNTFTGRLTEDMLDEIFDRARQLISGS
jgi:uracil-DNA glycosylase family 4